MIKRSTGYDLDEEEATLIAAEMLVDSVQPVVPLYDFFTQLHDNYNMLTNIGNGDSIKLN